MKCCLEHFSKSCSPYVLLLDESELSAFPPTRRKCRHNKMKVFLAFTTRLGCNTTKGKVLYLNFELADDEMQERIEAVKIARCITLENGQLDVWNLSEHAAPYDVILPTIYERIKTPLQECSGSFLLSGIKGKCSVHVCIG